ncbi:MAG TPA: hypothetical protein VJX29_04820 [Candidatus Acidoferrales bacterium]|nr:hypothetical protein [Candidatus Acidoferrales bacterium]
MKLRTLAVLLLLAAVPCFAQAPPEGVTLKVRVEATALDKSLLLGKLNDNGKDHDMAFRATSGPWEYRIVFRTYQLIAPDGAPRSGARAIVYGKNGRELFTFSRDMRHTDAGATNAVAKEIIKRLRELR